MTNSTKSNSDGLAARGGPGWGYSILMSSFTFIVGIGTGMISNGTLDAVSSFDNGTAARATAPKLHVSEPNLTGRTENAKIEYFPENNHIQWGISLRPGTQTQPYVFENESGEHNLRIIFQYLTHNAAPQNAAVLHIRAGQSARISLPAANYRLDLISTPANMPWHIANAQRATPKFALSVKHSDDEIISGKKVFIGAEGDIRLPKSSRAPSPPKNHNSETESTSEDPTDYRSIIDDQEPDT